MFRSSISQRLVASAVFWIICVLVVTGFVLIEMFRDHVEPEFDAYLREHVEELLALSAVDDAGRVYLKRHPVDPSFNRPFSGWYWQIKLPGNPLIRSRSLADAAFAEPPEWPRGGAIIYKAPGPEGQRLRIYGRAFTLPDSAQTFLIMMAGAVSKLETSVRAFGKIVIVTLTLLGLGLCGAVVIQVRYGLQPLRRLGCMLSDVRAGRAARLEGSLPVEVAPLAGEVNALLDHNATVIERARTQADDLAHALKTPLTVLTNEAARIQGGTGDVMRQQTALMNERVGHHLSRARAAGSRVLGARTKVGPVVERLSRTLRRIFVHRRIDVALNSTEDLDFQGEYQDLEEMLGNLMENGCKWSHQKVRISAERRNGAVTLIVEDDGPGIPEALRSRVLDRGQRLDESAPGSGIGLSIVCEMAELYGGGLTLGCSPLGGLEARLRLPAAPETPTVRGT